MSSNILQLNQDIGWQRQAASETDPITSVDPIFFKFGKYTSSGNKFPKQISEIALHYRGTSRKPYNKRVSKTNVAGGFNYSWTNGLPFFMILAKEESAPGEEDGGVVETSDGVFRIDGYPIGFLEEYVIRYRSDNDQNRIQRVCIDSRISRVVGSVDFDDPTAPFAGGITFMSKLMTIISSGSDAAVSSQAANNNEFFLDPNTILKWGTTLNANGQYSSGGLDLTPYAIEFSFACDVLAKPLKIITQHFPTFIATGRELWSWHLKIRRTDETSMFDHFLGTTVTVTGASDNSQAGLSYAGSEAFKNLSFKIFAKNAAGAVANYIQLDLEGCSIGEMDMNFVDETETEEAYYDFTGFALNGVPTIVDECEEVEYGIT